MTRDHMKMLLNVVITASNTQVWIVTEEQLEKFAELVTAAEREACAKIADDEANDAMTAGEHNPKSNAAWNISMTAKRVADAIRARSET